MATLELVEQFLGWGWCVDVSTNLYLSPMADEFQKLPGQERLRVSSDWNDTFAEHYDLIWIQHALLPKQVLEGLSRGEYEDAMVIWHHLSSVVEMELPILANIEMEVADVSTAISEKVKDTLVRFGLQESKIGYFKNPAPDGFGKIPLGDHPDELSRLLVVSNHPPVEVQEAVSLFQQQGIQCDMLGDMGQVRRITPEVLLPYQAVITIGKTVQYALSMGIPCYCYDHFGGVGWVMQSNVKQEETFHFSGKTTGRKIAAGEIYRECVEGFGRARAETEANRQMYARRYSLSNNLSNLLEETKKIQKKKRLSPESAQQWMAFAMMLRHYFLMCQGPERVSLMNKCKEQKQRLLKKDKEIRKLKNKTGKYRAYKSVITEWNAKPWYVRMFRKLRV